jgi:mono/diheme cytochrome c family protein
MDRKTILALTALAACAQLSIALGQRAGDTARGQQLYYDHGCYGCHGFNGETGARDLVGTNSPIVADLNTFTTYLRLRADVAPLLPSTRMPNYPESTLSDADLRDIFAFVSSLQLNAPAIEDIPTLQAILDSADRPYRP